MLDNEILVDTLREEYPDEITEIIQNCQFAGKNYLDVESLNSRLRALRITNFMNESLSEDQWFELLYELAPDIYDDLAYGKLAA